MNNDKFREIISKTIIPLQNDEYLRYIVGKNKFTKIIPNNDVTPLIYVVDKNRLVHF